MVMGSRRFHRIFLLVLGFLVATPSSAWAWGCEGHQMVASIAERHLNPHAAKMSRQILDDSPIDPTLARYCKQKGLDPFVDSSTWADDERSVKRDTGPWHFIDIPRGAPKGAMAQYCPASTGCVVSALAAQVRVLRDPKASAGARADALRFVIHLVGDIHQPLHATTNDDMGGNCVPVTFFGLGPRETNLERESYSPNLHGVWDAGIIGHFAPPEDAQAPTPQQVADELGEADKIDRDFRLQFPTWRPGPIDFAAWAWESHELAEKVAYGRLPHAIPIEPPRPVASCADDDHISTRMLHLDERLGEDYENPTAPVVQEQLAKAGLRLAALLHSIWP
ncbi:MAG: S1/P1 nuclease [Candidatus Acidiferrales bacterium]